LSVLTEPGHPPVLRGPRLPLAGPPGVRLAETTVGGIDGDPRTETAARLGRPPRTSATSSAGYAPPASPAAETRPSWRSDIGSQRGQVQRGKHLSGLGLQAD